MSRNAADQSAHAAQADGSPGLAPQLANAAGPGSRLARLRRLRNHLAAQSLVPISACLGPRFCDAFGILLYHRVVASPAAASPPTWNVTPRRFRQQLVGLLRRGYRPSRSRGALGSPCRPMPGVQDVRGHLRRRLRERLSPRVSGASRAGRSGDRLLATRFLDSDGPFPFDDWADAGSSRVGRRRGGRSRRVNVRKCGTAAWSSWDRTATAMPTFAVPPKPCATIWPRRWRCCVANSGSTSRASLFPSAMAAAAMMGPSWPPWRSGRESASP